MYAIFFKPKNHLRRRFEPRIFFHWIHSHATFHFRCGDLLELLAYPNLAVAHGELPSKASYCHS
jgi:hypothetical protein